jgi:hypothetical protein
MCNAVALTPAPATARTASIVLQSPLLYAQPYSCDHTIPEGTHPPPRCTTCRAAFLPVLMLARSPIHGMGVFTAHSLAPGTEVVALAGKWVRDVVLTPRDESLTHPEDRRRVWRSRQPDVLTFINHSATPNCSFVVPSGGDIPHLLVGAAHIRAWTELTIDYGSRYTTGEDSEG